MTTELRVVRTTSWAAAIGDFPESCGGMGGWVSSSIGWAEYLEAMPAQQHAHLEALRRWVLAEGIRRGGDWHQAGGVPVFSDGTVGAFSMRGWGDLLAAIWNTEEAPSYSYMDFYME